MRPINIIDNELNHNKNSINELENSSFEEPAPLWRGGAVGAGCLLEKKKGTEPQQIPTFISPSSLINIRINKDCNLKGEIV